MVWLFLLGRLVVAAMTLNAARHRAARARNVGVRTAGPTEPFSGPASHRPMQ
jgi:hypothetical protein